MHAWGLHLENLERTPYNNLVYYAWPAASADTEFDRCRILTHGAGLSYELPLLLYYCCTTITVVVSLRCRCLGRLLTACVYGLYKTNIVGNENWNREVSTHQRSKLWYPPVVGLYRTWQHLCMCLISQNWNYLRKFGSPQATHTNYLIQLDAHAPTNCFSVQFVFVEE